MSEAEVIKSENLSQSNNLTKSNSQVQTLTKLH
jgi:hypothetical protein